MTPITAASGSVEIATTCRYAHLIVDAPLPQPLDYRLSDLHRAAAQRGARCVIPFGSGKRIGVLVGFSDHTELAEHRIKPLTAILDDAPPLGDAWLALTRFAAEYYQSSWGEVALPALPPTLRKSPGPRHEQTFKRLRAADTSAPVQANSAQHALTAAQQAACDAIVAALDGDAAFKPFLLFGVTGSGKTDVYLAVIGAALARSPKAQALLLVPEINLTPQLQARLQRHFPGEPMVTMNSAMAEAERASAWLAAHEGRARIVLGTRLAVFASMPHLAVVAVDEEHDASYKAGDGVRFSARDLAVKWAQLAGVPIVLGSATPSLESWARAQDGKYLALVLSERAAAGAGVGHLPKVDMVDLTVHPLVQGLSGPVRAALADTLAKGEQSLVFLNRRGYAPVVSCQACGWLSDCLRCSTYAAFHKVDRVLRCHHCGWQQAVPRACPGCGNQDLSAVGQGTQRVEEQLAHLLPTARISRIDRDSTRRRHAARDAFAAVHAGETDVLVGTQMVAKGHDFRHVTLVVVLNADAQLVNTDFRAPERLFATLMQVAGRAGRGEQPGRVLIQTRYPTHPLYVALAAHDYAAFAAGQLRDRRDAGLPPYVAQALLTAEARDMPLAIRWLEHARELGEQVAAESALPMRLFDAVPMPLARLADVERAQVLVEADQRGVLQRFLAQWLPQLRESARSRAAAAAVGNRTGVQPPEGSVRWQIDVDPQHI